MRINRETTLYLSQSSGSALERGLIGFDRDMEAVFGTVPLRVSDLRSNQIRLALSGEPDLPPEDCIIISSSDTLEISASDDLGFVFGLYWISEQILGVDPLSLWSGFKPAPRDFIDTGAFRSRISRQGPRFRGWFINDEDCLTAWDDSVSITEDTWCRIFETILRCGYNLVIPGTGISSTGKQLDLASEFGLWIAQHHAEPLGAQMFSDAYPGVPAMLPEEKHCFEELYRKSVHSAAGRKMIWTVGFRGQGDRPFSEDDPRYKSQEAQGELISSMIRLQQDIVREIAGENQTFIHYIYSETGKLYRDGHLRLPEDVIRVYSDNGFGAMRVRRELCGPEPGISSKPGPGDSGNSVGVYYHISFHDLHISNKLVPLVSRGVMEENLRSFTQHNHFDFFLLNVSNIRPHILQIQQLRALWEKSHVKDSLGLCLEEKTLEWLRRGFPGREREVLALLDAYFAAPLSFNDLYTDARAGEQLYHHGLRRLIRALIRKEDVRPWFAYIPEEFTDNRDCTLWIYSRAAESLPQWEALAVKSAAFEESLEGWRKEFFGSFLGMHIHYIKESCEGFVQGCEASLSYQKGEYIDAFTGFYLSLEAMKRALHALEAGDQGEWTHFHRGDWLTGTAETVRCLKTALSYTRITGENLICNSEWVIRALGLTETAIATMPQATVPDSVLAEGFLGNGPETGPQLLKRNKE